MCGIAGFIDYNRSTTRVQLESMVESLRHRGPDNQGIEIFSDQNAQIGFGHARLSVIDLSSSGHQPMSISNIHVVFNGEIYNYKELRSDLSKKEYSFTSDSDTEVILYAFKEWGVKCVERFIGMFAIVLYDASTGQVYFFRDRAGVKPLFYYESDGLLLFGSELKALMSNPQFPRDIDKNVLPEYLNYGFIPAPGSIFKNTKKVMPGSYVSYNLRTKLKTEVVYWDIAHYYNLPKLDLSYNEALEELHERIKSAYSYRMVSDVPVGVFLSGGYDSTSVAAVLSNKSKEKIRTFTIGFYQGNNNEAPQAKQIADVLGTNHTELYCTQEDAKDIIRELPSIYDEPFADSSSIPTILVSRMAKEHVTVALSGDGGDEQFFGYNHHFQQYFNHKLITKLQGYGLGNSTLVNFFEFITKKTPLISNTSKHKVQTALSALKADKYAIANLLYFEAKRKPKDYIYKWLLPNDFTECSLEYKLLSKSSVDVFSYMDYINHLPNDYLTKVDRATMSTSIEGREPLLDHRIAEFAARIPDSFKFDMKKRTGKKILKDIVHKYVSKEIMDKPKRGFSIPVLNWLKGDLSYLLDKYLSKEALIETNTFDPEFVDQELKSFLAGNMHYTRLIWYVLTYQMWYYKWIK